MKSDMPSILRAVIFRQKKWGRVKIEYALRQKRVSEPNIKRAMKEIVGEDYQAALQKLAETKWESPKSRAIHQPRSKNHRFSITKRISKEA